MRDVFLLYYFTVVFCVALSAETPASALDSEPALSAFVMDYHDMAAFNGVILIAEGSQIVWQQAFGYSDYDLDVPLTIDSRFRLASLSEHVTKAAVGRLQDNGKLSVQSRLAEFMPDFPNAQRITIQHLVAHSAGIAPLHGQSWMATSEPVPHEEIIARLAQETLQFRPGTEVNHSDGGFALLAEVIQRASGLSYGEFIRATITESGYASIGHENARESAPGLASRYSPGPAYGERVNAETYVAANSIGAGSIYANTADVLHFFRDSYSGRLLSTESTRQLFKKPASDKLTITGVSPGTFAHVYLDFSADLTIVILSANSARLDRLGQDILALYRGETIAQPSVTLARSKLPAAELQAFRGEFRTSRFSQLVTIEADSDGLRFDQGEISTAFARTTRGDFHLPFYDWLCQFSAYNTEFVCHARTAGDAQPVFFERQ